MQVNAKKKCMFIIVYYIALGALVCIQIILIFSVMTKNAQGAFPREWKRQCKVRTIYKLGWNQLSSLFSAVWWQEIYD